MIQIVRHEEFSRYKPVDATLHNCCEYIPLLHQVLTCSDEDHFFPSVPRNDDLYAAIRYWDLAFYYLTVVLGWADPGLGLSWYYKEGKQTSDDYRIKVLREIWDNESQLELLALWVWTRKWGYIRELLLKCANVIHKIPPFREVDNLEHLEPLLLKYRTPQNCVYQHNPYFGGGNPLHLGHFDFVLDRKFADPQFYHGDISTRSACLILDNCSGWYKALCNFGNTLPDLGEGLRDGHK